MIYVDCENCNGSGVVGGALTDRQCPVCNGKRVMRISYNYVDASDESLEVQTRNTQNEILDIVSKTYAHITELRRVIEAMNFRIKQQQEAIDNIATLVYMLGEKDDLWKKKQEDMDKDKKDMDKISEDLRKKDKEKENNE